MDDSRNDEIGAAMEMALGAIGEAMDGDRASYEILQSYVYCVAVGMKAGLAAVKTCEDGHGLERFFSHVMVASAINVPKHLSDDFQDVDASVRRDVLTLEMLSGVMSIIRGGGGKKDEGDAHETHDDALKLKEMLESMKKKGV